VHWNEIGGKRVPVVLMGDAAHTAHFSIGSGTKLALEDAIELSRNFARHGTEDLGEALAAYEAARSVEVLKLQSAARNSMEWFETVARYAHFEPEQFAYTLLTRSQRISHENLRVRDKGYVERYEQWFAQRAFELAGLQPPASPRPVPPMLTPFKVRDVVLANRIVVSPMAQYSASEGVPGDYHMVHLGARAMGGAGLVFAEMTCTSADARITPGCPGLWNGEQAQAWKRIVDFVHANTLSKIALQIGHAGPKGSTRAAWDGIDQPLPEGNWPLIAASDQQYIDGVSQRARAMTREDKERVKADFVRTARLAAEAGFDWLELHAAHGYLLSSFISPLTNERDDEYGGGLENRCRYPLEVFRAVREAWPRHLPMSVRISAHDWVPGGLTPQDAVDVAKMFKAAGADMIDVSSGQVSRKEQPVYGRMFQTPFSDRIRNEAKIPTIAVGAISEADHANSIVAAGRADLCAVARPHLANPAWTLLEAARIGFTDIDWPKQYRAAKVQLERNLERERQVAAANAGLTPQQVAAKLLEGG
jgi:anthraniloyl-CoA monooxygenase